MAKKRELLEYYIGKFENLSIVMLAMVWWMTNELSAEDRDYILNLIGYSYNESTKVVSKDNNTYNCYQMYKLTIEQAYPVETILDKELVTTFCDMAYFYKYLTQSQKDELVAML